MSHPDSRSIVVDANIAKSAGTSKDHMSINSRGFLDTLRTCGHRIAMSTEIEQEWNRRCSAFSIDWLSTMTENGQVLPLGDVVDESMRKRIRDQSPDVYIFRIMQKDIRLLEAARKTDMRVSSMDKRARFHFCNVCRNVEEIQDVMWVNPDTESEFCLAWLRRGAPVEAERQLGYQHRIA